jgi:hypothetical protein
MESLGEDGLYRNENFNLAQRVNTSQNSINSPKSPEIRFINDEAGANNDRIGEKDDTNVTEDKTSDFADFTDYYDNKLCHEFRQFE